MCGVTYYRHGGSRESRFRFNLSWTLTLTHASITDIPGTFNIQVFAELKEVVPDIVEIIIIEDPAKEDH